MEHAVAAHSGRHTRRAAAIALAAAWTTAFALAQTPTTPQGTTPATPQGQAPAAPPQGRGPAPTGEGQTPPARGRVNAPAGAAGQRVGGFTQYTRPINQDLVVRGKAVYEANCAKCHAPDMRGTADGKNPNLLHSGVTLRDQKGDLIVARVAKHTPPITLVADDASAILEYVHSIQATMGGQGSPPGRNPTNVTLNVLVGNPKSGEEAFGTMCGSCHSVTGNLKGFAAKFAEPRELQNAWVSGNAGAGGGRGRGGGRGGGGGEGTPAVVTMADGSKLQGSLVREDDFLIVLMLPDGTRKTIARTDGVPKVEVNDPKAGHVDAIVKLGHVDTTSGMMHDITAYLWSLK
jgi:mono/diheme cytochrome c family protein